MHFRRYIKSLKFVSKEQAFIWNIEMDLVLFATLNN